MWVTFALLSAVFAALTSILAKIGIEGVNSNLATAIRTAVVLVLAWGIVFATGAHHGISSIGTRSWIFLILSGVAKVVPIDKFSVVISIVLAFVILHEKVTWTTILGGALITAGTFVLIL